MLVWDVETDGLLDTVTKIHCINAIDRSTGMTLAFNVGVYADGSPALRDGTIEDGLKVLSESEAFGGHNLIGYDIPVVQKLYPQWTYRARVFDTLPCVNVIWTDIKDRDFAALKSGRLPHEFQKAGLIGRQSLEAWGYRLGVLKGTYSGSWEHFTQELDKYGRQDPGVSLSLIEFVEKKNYSPECLELEHDVYRIIRRQERKGFAFDMVKGEALAVKLRRRMAELEAEATAVFPPWEVTLPDFMPKRDNKTKGYKAGVPVKRKKLVVFNPGSRQQIADRLMSLHGWKPTKFTDGGQPVVDETVLEELPWPECKVLAKYFLVEKRLAQLVDGKKGAMKFAKQHGDHYRIHGGVQSNGAVTGRMTHSNPNVANTPTCEAEYGEEFRDCYTAAPGMVLVGCDAKGLELRCLGHYMAKWDGGEYAEIVSQGDPHEVNRAALGLNSRDVHAKRFIYAMLYGAGDFKLGTTVYEDFTDEVRDRFNARFPSSKKKARSTAIRNLGNTRRARLMTNLPALDKFLMAVKKAAQRGYLIGLDGRRIHVRSEHSAPNSLLQGAGAIVMKRALVILDSDFDLSIRSTGATVEFVANVHDEWQIETQPEIADVVGKLSADSIRRAGEYYGFCCPLAGSYKVGSSWSNTH